MTYRLDYYTQAELERILRRSAEILDVRLTDDAARLVARPLAWNAADREPAAEARPRLRPGPRWR